MNVRKANKNTEGKGLIKFLREKKNKNDEEIEGDKEEEKIDDQDKSIFNKSNRTMRSPTGGKAGEQKKAGKTEKKIEENLMQIMEEDGGKKAGVIWEGIKKELKGLTDKIEAKMEGWAEKINKVKKRDERIKKIEKQGAEHESILMDMIKDLKEMREEDKAREKKKEEQKKTLENKQKEEEAKKDEMQI